MADHVNYCCYMENIRCFNLPVVFGIVHLKCISIMAPSNLETKRELKYLPSRHLHVQT